MAHPALPVTILTLASVIALADVPGAAQTRVTIHERVSIRLPRVSAAPIQRIVSPQRAWKEHKGPDCIALGALSAAAITVPAAIDLLLIDGRWMRAKLEGSCRSADFYSGLYIRPGEDGRVCADRDAIRIRSGASCRIDRFRALRPKR